MSIDVYYFTHYFNDEAYHFKVYDTGNSRVLECNGTDILPLSNDKFGFCDNQGNQHILSFSFGFGNRRCFIDNVKYNYLGETNWYDSIFVLIPLISMIFIGLSGFFIALLNRYILRTTQNSLLRFALCFAVTLISITIVSVASFSINLITGL